MLFVLGVAFLAIAQFGPRRPVPVAAGGAPAEAAAAQPVLEGEVIAPRPAIAAPLLTWPSQVDPDAGALEPNERLRLIESLGIVGADWCAQMLALAYDEESGDLREAIVGAAGDCLRAGLPTLHRALGAENPAERALAIEGFSKIGELAPVEPLLDDASLPVAMGAAYALVRGGSGDAVESYLAGREDDVRTREIRTVLGVLDAAL